MNPPLETFITKQFKLGLASLGFEFATKAYHTNKFSAETHPFWLMQLLDDDDDAIWPQNGVKGR